MYYIYKKNGVNIFEEGRYNQNIMYDMLVQISSLLMNLNINKDFIGTIIEDLVKGSQKMVLREEQYKVMLVISQLYFNIFSDTKKVMDCFGKARLFADFAITNPKNLVLFVEYLNKILYFIDKDQKLIEIKPKQVEDFI